MTPTVAIAIHGGSGIVSKAVMTPELHFYYEVTLKKALYAGLVVLQNGGRSLDAVLAAVIELEDCPDFNAGKGSVLNRDGFCEMDAAIMDGGTLQAGAVAGITQVRNPIRLARAILDRGEYVLLSGTKALDLAREENLPMETDQYFVMDQRREEWVRICETGKVENLQRFGTVGAVALDYHGHLAAATSTGGLVNKAYGRVGDSCIIGCGTYANDNTCAVSCTGDGECFIRSVLAYDVSSRIEYQRLPLREACEKALNARIAPLGGSGGLIAIDRSGNIAMPFISEGMYRACFHANGTIECNIY